MKDKDKNELDVCKIMAEACVKGLGEMLKARNRTEKEKEKDELNEGGYGKTFFGLRKLYIEKELLNTKKSLHNLAEIICDDEGGYWGYRSYEKLSAFLRKYSEYPLNVCWHNQGGSGWLEVEIDYSNKIKTIYSWKEKLTVKENLKKINNIGEKINENK